MREEQKRISGDKHLGQSNKVEVWFKGSCAAKNPGGTASFKIEIKINGMTVHSASAIVGTGPAMSDRVAEYAAVNAVFDYLIEHQVTGDATIFGHTTNVINLLNKGGVAKGLCKPYSQRAVELKEQLLCSPKFVWVRLHPPVTKTEPKPLTGYEKNGIKLCDHNSPHPKYPMMCAVCIKQRKTKSLVAEWSKMLDAALPRSRDKFVGRY